MKVSTFFFLILGIALLTRCSKHNPPNNEEVCHLDQLLAGWSITKYELEIDINERDADFPTPSIGYVAGYDGMVIKTRDSGKTWRQLNVKSNLNFLTIDFTDAVTGFVGGVGRSQSLDSEAGKGAPFFRTDNGGITWTKKYFPAYSVFYEMVFFNDQTGLAFIRFSGTGTPVRLMKTTDGGDTWNQVTTIPLKAIPTSFHRQKLFRTPSKVIFPRERNLYVSTDQGQTWDSINTPVDVRNDIRNFFPVNDDIFYLDGVTSIFKTEDGGTTWQEQNVPFTYFDFVHFSSEKEGFILNPNAQYQGGDFPVFTGNTAFQTTDGGAHWTEVFVEQDCNVAGLKGFPQSEFGYSVGNNIYRFVKE